ncbi:MAG: DedA family protein [Proteobacteria bacterium]|nr:DedA family protein [Pseudomonadota bacterium]
MDSIAHLVAQYGYWVVVAGCLLEGETVLVLAGFAARQGLLSLPVVMALGACAGALSDVALFGLGRWRGAALLARWPRIAAYREPLNRLLGRWGAWVVVGVRFMYGMRIAGPVLLGMSDLPWWRFLGFNLLGAALWGVGVAGLGWLFGHAAQAALGHVQRAEHWVGAGLLVAMLAWGGWRWWRRRRPGR